MSLHLNSRLCGNVYVIRCTGRIVLGDEARALEAALEQGSHHSRRLVLNLAGVDRLDSLGLGLLVRVCTGLGTRGGDLRLAECPDALVALLKLTTLTRLFKLFRTEEAAVASFRKLSALPKLPAQPGTRLLVFDPSPDLCVFLRSVLSCHGFEVHSATRLQEACDLLASTPVEVLLVGPCTVQISPSAAAMTLAEGAPQATVLRLPSGFKSFDAHRATETLLALFAVPELP